MANFVFMVQWEENLCCQALCVKPLMPSLAIRSRRVATYIVPKSYGEVISAMPFIRPKHLRAMVRKDLGVFISNKVNKNTKTLVIKNLRSISRKILECQIIML